MTKKCGNCKWWKKWWTGRKSPNMSLCTHKLFGLIFTRKNGGRNCNRWEPPEELKMSEWKELQGEKV